MMRLRPDETKLVGRWEFAHGRMTANADAERIQAVLASGSLEKLASADGGWTTLYRDPGDGRLWELSYPDGQLHGGGPPTLTCITVEDAKRRYPI